LLAGVPLANAKSPGPSPLDAGDEWIVTLRPGADPAVEATRLSRAAGGSVQHVYENVIQGFSFVGSATDAAALGRNPAVASVVRSRVFQIADETLPFGIQRVDAYHPAALDAQEAGFTGAGVRIGVLDTGIDLDHPDLTVDPELGINCMGPGAPEDGHGHGTHVAGTSAAIAGNDLGVIGIAPDATVVPVKVLDDSGVGTDATVICGVDYLTGLASDGDPTNDVLVANMSLGEESSNVGDCNDGGLHEAICESIVAGVTYVVAAGNSSIDTAGFVPAAYPEVITVSAISDLDGEPGGLGGCFFFICDDGLAFFSNYGTVVDVTAPGYNVYSTWKDGGYSTNSGTSMAAPHVAGVVALVKAANPELLQGDIEQLLKVRGECPDGTWTDEGPGEADCAGQGSWPGDPDGVAEPIVNALLATNGGDHLPKVTITSPADGAAVAGLVEVVADATDDEGVDHVAFAVNGSLIAEDSDGSDGWTATWDASALAPGVYTVTARVTDSAGQTASDIVSVNVGINAQGDWVGEFGADGYALLAWDGAAGDLVALPAATLVWEQGSRAVWQSPSSEARALEAPDEGSRRLTTGYHPSQLRLRLDFSAPYSGDLHLYAVDGDTSVRRQVVTLSGGDSSQQVAITTDFSQGAWMHFPVDVVAGESLTISVDRTAGANAVLSGLFLGPGGAPAEPPPYETQPQGDWVGSYGADGHALLAWNGGSDEVSVPTATLVVERGARHVWQSASGELRALESADEETRRLAALYDFSQIRLRLDFSAAYSGELHVYAVDGDATTRRETVTVEDGSGPQAVNLATDFSQGAWMHFPVSVPAGGSVTVTVDRTGGPNAVLSGVFLGAGGPSVAGDARTAAVSLPI